MDNKGPENKPDLIDDTIKTAVKRYQCSGCVCGFNTKCYEKGGVKHVENTLLARLSAALGGFFGNAERL